MRQQEIEALLSDMSLEEKIGELFQLPSYFFNGDMVTGPAGELGITSDDLRVSGSCLSVAGAKKIYEIQKTHFFSSFLFSTLSQCCSWRISSTDTVPFSRFPLPRAVLLIPAGGGMRFCRSP